MKKFFIVCLALSLESVSMAYVGFFSHQQRELMALGQSIQNLPGGTQMLINVFSALGRGGIDAAKEVIWDTSFRQFPAYSKVSPLLARYLFLELVMMATPQQKIELLENVIQCDINTIGQTGEQMKLFALSEKLITQLKLKNTKWEGFPMWRNWQVIISFSAFSSCDISYTYDGFSEIRETLMGVAPELVTQIGQCIQSLLDEHNAAKDIWNQVDNYYYLNGRDNTKVFLKQLAQQQKYASMLKEGEFFRDDLDAWIMCPKNTVSVLRGRLEEQYSDAIFNRGYRIKNYFPILKQIESLDINGNTFEEDALAIVKKNAFNLSPEMIVTLKELILAMRNPSALS